jgi:hypothetical protein
MCEHNHFKRKKSVRSGIISSTMHLKSGYSFHDSFFGKTLAKRSEKYVYFRILSSSPTSH